MLLSFFFITGLVCSEPLSKHFLAPKSTDDISIFDSLDTQYSQITEKFGQLQFITQKLLKQIQRLEEVGTQETFKKLGELYQVFGEMAAGINAPTPASGKEIAFIFTTQNAKLLELSGKLERVKSLFASKEDGAMEAAKELTSEFSQILTNVNELGKWLPALVLELLSEEGVIYLDKWNKGHDKLKSLLYYQGQPFSPEYQAAYDKYGTALKAYIATINNPTNPVDDIKLRELRLKEYIQAVEEGYPIQLAEELKLTRFAREKRENGLTLQEQLTSSIIGVFAGVKDAQPLADETPPANDDTPNEPSHLEKPPADEQTLKDQINPLIDALMGEIKENLELEGIYDPNAELGLMGQAFLSVISPKRARDILKLDQDINYDEIDIALRTALKNFKLVAMFAQKDHSGDNDQMDMLRAAAMVLKAEISGEKIIVKPEIKGSFATNTEIDRAAELFWSAAPVENSLTALGVTIDATPEEIDRALEERILIVMATGKDTDNDDQPVSILDSLRLAAKTLKSPTKSLEPKLDPMFDPDIYDAELVRDVYMSIEQAANHLKISVNSSPSEIRSHLRKIMAGFNGMYIKGNGGEITPFKMESLKKFGRILIAA